MFDIIGDIHGHADELESLLNKLGYSKQNGTYSHPHRKALFVGDYIDRGPKIRQTLYLVKSMVDKGSAIALMGNHEYNALCFHYQDKEGGHLRKHLIKNIIQHYETLNQFQNKQKEYETYIEWFKTLPLYFENKTFRAVHACWDNANIEYLRENLVNDRLTDDLIYESVKKGTLLNQAIDQTLKGKEMKMPNSQIFFDKDGEERTQIRIKWWENPKEMTYKSICVEPMDNLPSQPVLVLDSEKENYYNPSEKPIFFGHYWLKGLQNLQKSNVCCLDYSVAKGGNLVAYRFDSETELDNKKFMVV
jgi:hypothetical protein